jgi:surfactin synthase thioesterase subunit
MHVIFSHGLESTPWGSKINHLATLCNSANCIVHSVDYQGINSPSERVEKLITYIDTELKPDDPFLLVGSSMGGYVSMVTAQSRKPQGIFLLAPALYINSYLVQEYPTDCQVSIVHGYQDDVIPFENSLRYAKETHNTLHLIDGDHRLNDALETLSPLFMAFIHSNT